jgi:phytoene dehydrogenase-like protein
MRAAAVVSAVDPKTTFLQLIDAVQLSPDFLSKIRGYRAAGTLAKVNLALSALPAFAGPADAGRHVRPDAEVLSGRIHLGPDLDYLERAFDHAKYGELSEAPWLDVAIPSIVDPDLAPSGAHVMSVYVHYAPYRLRGGEWTTAKRTLLDRTLAVLDRFAPGIARLVVAADAITPAELETRFGFHSGHIFHGELALDQLLSMRPVPGFGRYRAPLRGLYLCGAGTHPGGFMSGGSGRLAAREVVTDVSRRLHL